MTKDVVRQVADPIYTMFRAAIHELPYQLRPVCAGVLSKSLLSALLIFPSSPKRPIKLLGHVPPPSINGSDHNHIAKLLYTLSRVAEDIITNHLFYLRSCPPCPLLNLGRSLLWQSWSVDCHA